MYIYSLKTAELRSIEIDEMDVYDFQFINETKDLIIRFGIDKNQNGAFSDWDEPTIIKRYNFDEDKLIEVVDIQTHSQLQKMLEGTK